jgi:hypothetical protein
MVLGLNLSLPTPCYYKSLPSLSAIFYHLTPVISYILYVITRESTGRYIVFGTGFARAGVRCLWIFG